MGFILSRLSSDGRPDNTYMGLLLNLFTNCVWYFRVSVLFPDADGPVMWIEYISLLGSIGYVVESAVVVYIELSKLLL